MELELGLVKARQACCKERFELKANSSRLLQVRVVGYVDLIKLGDGVLLLLHGVISDPDERCSYWQAVARIQRGGH